jgi:hypothetical protein
VFWPVGHRFLDASLIALDGYLAAFWLVLQEGGTYYYYSQRPTAYELPMLNDLKVQEQQDTEA